MRSDAERPGVRHPAGETGEAGSRGRDTRLGGPSAGAAGGRGDRALEGGRALGDPGAPEGRSSACLGTGGTDRPFPTGLPGSPGVGSWGPVALFAYAVLAATYFVVRTGGRLADIDSGQVALGARAVAESASIVPPSGTIYPSGYAFEVVTDALVAFTGVPLPSVLVVVYPLVSAGLVFAAWALYRELTGSARTATLAVLLLFLQPEFLFAVFRGSHERQVRLLMFVALWLLARCVRGRSAPHRRGAPRDFAVWMGLLYLVVFALVATNALFGISFIAALGAALGATWALGRCRAGLAPPAGASGARLGQATLGLTVVGFAFVAYVYPPAVADLRALGRVWREVAALLLTTGGRNPYMAVQAGWVGLPAYVLVGAGDYLLMGASACVWLWQGVRWLRRGGAPPEPGIWLLWTLYGAFALQGALAVVSDLTGLLGGNAEHRSFPSFAMLATPLVARALAAWRPPPWAARATFGAAALLALLALLKATDEPAVSNTWLFYTPGELRALAWADAHARDAQVWVGPDGRLRSAYELAVGESARGNTWDAFAPKPGTRSFVITDVMRLQLARLGKPLPDLSQADRVYDNGSAQVYHLLPETPYQR